MKKIIVVFLALFTFIIFSCESTSVNNEDDVITNPKISETQKNDESLNDENLSSSLLPEPEDFEEPLVRDLELPPVEETEIAVAETPVNQTDTEQEDLETKNSDEEKDIEIPVPTQVDEQTKTEVSPLENTSKTSETENVKIADIKENQTKTDTAKQNNTNTRVPSVSPAKDNSKITEQKKTSETKENEKTIEADIQLNPSPIEDKETAAPLPSRSVTVNTNETLTVKYPGFGWIYLGSNSEKNNLASTGRKVTDNETIYTLTAKNPGTQIHQFYKIDSLTGDYIDDYLEVIVTPNQGSVYTVVQAPDYKDIVPERPESPSVAATKKTVLTPEQKEMLEKKEVKPSGKRDYEVYIPELEDTKEETKNSASVINETYIEDLDADDLLEKAKNLFDQKKFEDSQKYLTSFMEIATEKRDEGLFLQGQIFEQDGSTKNIKNAIFSYRNLVDNYPESYYWDDANKRIIYLNRFYIQIR